MRSANRRPGEAREAGLPAPVGVGLSGCSEPSRGLVGLRGAAARPGGLQVSDCEGPTFSHLSAREGGSTGPAPGGSRQEPRRPRGPSESGRVGVPGGAGRGAPRQDGGASRRK